MENMARVPTWTELRLDATRLAHLQKECYRSVHHLLDSSLPELDRKISSLNLHKDFQSNIYETIPHELVALPQKQVPVLQQTQPKSVVQQTRPAPQHAKPPSVVQQAPVIQKTRPEPVVQQARPTKVVQQTRSTTVVKKTRPTTVDEKTKPTKIVQQTRPESPKISRGRPAPMKHDDLEHLKPLPIPLSEYLKLNRPEIVERVEKRAMYLKKKSEKRRYYASEKMINSLERIRLSSRNSRQCKKQAYTSPPQVRNYVVPEYQIKYKLSEHEMRRLTAKHYNRLPEVKRRRKEEVTNHMKVQNYKNKLEYGRKLGENRRQGIINYPLRSESFDDTTSMTSTLDDCSINMCGRAADPFRSDPYY